MIACICTHQGMSQPFYLRNPVQRKTLVYWGWMNWLEILTMLYGLCEYVPRPTSAVWLCALHPRTDASSANCHGWSIGTNNKITINWIIELPAPQQLLELEPAPVKRAVRQPCALVAAMACNAQTSSSVYTALIVCKKEKARLMRAATMVIQMGMNPVDDASDTSFLIM